MDNSVLPMPKITLSDSIPIEVRESRLPWKRLDHSRDRSRAIAQQQQQDQSSAHHPLGPASHHFPSAVHSSDHAAPDTMIDVASPKTRRDRTFIGSECAVCEEPLEHTLRGERILQLSCSHVAHEACFYEYIKEFECQECPTCEAPLGLDTSRGGTLNFGTRVKSSFPTTCTR